MMSSTPHFVGFEMEVGAHWTNTDTAKAGVEPASALVAAHRRLCGWPGGESDGGAGEFDGNGFRVYRDHAHCEVASPLVPSAAALVLSMRHARSLVADCQREAERQGKRMRVSFNCTNRQDVAWGAHVNVLVARRVFDAWREAQWAPLRPQWIPFLVTSLPLVGTGKVGAEQGAPDCAFQFSQKADFIDAEVGLETVTSKSLINTRDEPLADPARYARLHIIAWDTNLMEFATWLKPGVTQVLLALVAEAVPLPRLELDDPLLALRVASRDLKLREPLRLKTGRRETALGVQRRLAEAAAQEVQKGCAASAVPDANHIVQRWIETVDDLEARRPRLNRRLDWCAKLRLLGQARRPQNIDHQQALLLDLHYAEVGGLFEKLEKAGVADRLEDFLPPGSLAQGRTRLGPREQARADLVTRFRSNLAGVDWDHAVGKDADGRRWFIQMNDPLDSRDLLQVVTRTPDWSTCLRGLIQAGLATPTVGVCAAVSSGHRGTGESVTEERPQQK